MLTNKLPFTIQCQGSQVNWCWAAVSASVSLSYDASSAWTQCTIASACLPPQDCCAQPGPCDVYGYLDKALGVTGNFVPPLAAALAAINIQNQIDHGQFIGVRIAWSRGGAHFVAIYGYDDETNGFFVLIGDPYYNNSWVNLLSFVNGQYGYQQDGTWTTTYYTQSAGGGGGGAPMKAKSVQSPNLAKALSFHQALATTANRRLRAANLPHDIYVINFESLERKRVVFVKRGHRVIDSSDPQNVAVYDLSDKGPNATLQRVVPNHTYSSGYAATVRQFSASMPGVKVRLVRQLQLKFEALWLHDRKNAGNDIFLALRTAAGFTAGAPYNRAEFVERILAAAAGYEKSDDPLIGG